MKMKFITKNITVLAALTIFFGICAGPIANGFGATFTPMIAQEFITSSEDAPSTFTYAIKEKDEVARGTYVTVNITGTGSAYAKPLEFSGPGTYEFEVFQVINDPQPGYRYDTRVYTIKARVNGSYMPEITIYNSEGIKTDTMAFRNFFDLQPTDPALMVDPPVRKTVIGEPAVPGVFTFKLVAREATQPMPSGSSNGVKTMTIRGSGEGEFGTWSYYEPGTYYYSIMEVNTGEAGYTYDAAVYTITDMVSEADGALILNRVVTNNMNAPVASMSYINKYTGANTGPTPSKSPDPSTPTNPTGPSGPSGPSNPGTGPKTGDDTNTTLYIVLLAAGMAMTGAAISYLIMGRKNGKKAKRERYE